MNNILPLKFAYWFNGKNNKFQYATSTAIFRLTLVV